MYLKFASTGTVHNTNSKSSPGTYSRQRKTSITLADIAAVKAIIDWDAVKEISDGHASLVKSSCRNGGLVDQNTWMRCKKELKYHPYKPVSRQQLNQADLPVAYVSFSVWGLGSIGKLKIISNLHEKIGHF